MTTYGFIDGAHFRASIDSTREYFGIPYELDFDFQSFFNNAFYHPDRVFWYDALPSKKSGQSDEDHKVEYEKTSNFFDMLNALDAVHVKTGVSTYQKSRKRIQKGVDILLALDVYRNAVAGVENILVFASDGDFHPVLEALQSTRARSRLFCNRRAAPLYLTELADYVQYFNELDLASYFFRLPEEKRLFSGGSGTTSDYRQYEATGWIIKHHVEGNGEVFTVLESHDQEWLVAFSDKRGPHYLQAATVKGLAKLLEREMGLFEAKFEAI